MAVSDTLLSTGIGLQATLDAPARVFAKRQNEEIARKKLRAQQEMADQDALNKALSDYDLDPNKYHRLVQGDVVAVTNDAINKIIDLKESGDPNWRNRVQREVASEWKNNIAHLSGLSTQYTAFEKGYNTTSNYRTRNQQELKSLMDESENYEDFISKAKSKGLSGMDIESGLIVDNAMNFDKAINVNLELDKNFRSLDPIKVNFRRKPGPNGTVIEEYDVLMPGTIKEAQEMVGPYNLTQRPVSLEDVLLQNIEDPVFLAQFADKYGLDPNNYDQIRDRALQYGREFTQREIGRYTYRPGMKIITNIGQEEQSPMSWSREPSSIGTAYLSIGDGIDNSESLGNYGIEITGYRPGRTSSLVKVVAKEDGTPRVDTQTGTDAGELTITGFYILPTMKNTDGVEYPAIGNSNPENAQRYEVWTRSVDSATGKNIYWQRGVSARTSTASRTTSSNVDKNIVIDNYESMSAAALLMNNHLKEARKLAASKTSIKDKQDAFYSYIQQKWRELPSD